MKEKRTNSMEETYILPYYYTITCTLLCIPSMFVCYERISKVNIKIYQDKF